MTTEEAIKEFGFNPEHIGLRHRGWWVIEDDKDDDAPKGSLCVSARDGGNQERDAGAYKKENYISCVQDDTDVTYVYYHFKPLTI